MASPFRALSCAETSSGRVEPKPPRSRSDEREIEALRELLNCVESALKALEKSDEKREPCLKTVRVNLQVSRNLVRYFLSSLGAPYPPP